MGLVGADLQLVGPDYKAIAKDVVAGTLVIVDPQSGAIPTTARDTIAGLLEIVEKAGRTIGSLERRIKEEEDPDHHPQGKDIRWLFEQWQEGSGHHKAKLGGPRVKLIKARIRDGYPVRSDKPEPSLELAVYGICAYPFASYDHRSATEKAGYKRKDDFDLAMRDEKHVESLARLGWKARREGWTPSTGWRQAA